MDAPHVTLNDEEDRSPKVRMEGMNDASVSALLNPSSQPKNARYRSHATSRHDLRSQQQLTTPHLIAQNLIDSHFFATCACTSRQT